METETDQTRKNQKNNKERVSLRPFFYVKSSRFKNVNINCDIDYKKMCKFMKYIILYLISFSAFAINPMAGYQTSNIKDENYLIKLFNQLHRNKRSSSECYERAHVWSYQMHKIHNINSQKMFVFFTNKYKREINGQWWFHVAPGVLFNNELYMFDPEFLDTPVTYESWKNGCIEHAVKKLTPIKIKYEKEITSLLAESPNANTRRGRKRIAYIRSRVDWLKSELKRMLLTDKKIIKADHTNWPFDDGRKEMIDINCPLITNYSEWKVAQETEYCYMQPTNMFVWEPSELEKLENEDQNKEAFVNSEVYTSYKKGFRGRFPYRFDQ